MEDTEKYLIHAAITADGIVERSDVVGAIFGQTEGLLGDDLDLRDLQQSSKVGRIDVEIDSRNGQSFGTVTIASSLDRVKTAILAASLETITRVGPCRATVEVTDIEDVREAKRREVVERAKELLSESFDESVMSSTEILDEVKESVRIEDISEYEGLPAGPRVADSDAVVVVEGRADVLTLLSYGIKNAVAVEGTNVPEAVADLTQDRTTTAFFDGDRGGELILRELQQVGHVDFVAFAPKGRSVEDLKRHEVFAALRDKVSLDAYEREQTGAPADDAAEAAADGDQPDPRKGSPTTESAARAEPTPPAGSQQAVDTQASPADGTPDSHDEAPTTDASTELFELSADSVDTEADSVDGEADASDTEVDASDANPDADDVVEAAPDSTDAPADAANESTLGQDDAASDTDDTEPSEPSSEEAAAPDADTQADEADADAAAAADPLSLRDHVREVIDGDTGTIRLLNEDLATVSESPAADAFEALSAADPAPYAAVVDGEFTQRLLDLAAQRGVEHAVASSTGEFVKKPVGVRLLTADQLAKSVPN